MAKPYIHAISSAKKYGGEAEDYLDIHEFMDSSKATFPDNRHRSLTHNSWFIKEVIPRVFGKTRTNSAGRMYIPEDIAEQHVLEDFSQRFIPSPGDYIENMDFRDWMDNGRKGCPSSHRKINETRVVTEVIRFDRD